MKGWDKLHIIALDNPQHARLLSPIPIPANAQIPGFASDNLGAYYKGFRGGLVNPEKVELPMAPGTTTKFRLLAEIPKPPQNCSAKVQTFIEHVDADGKRLVRRHLITATRGLECGE